MPDRDGAQRAVELYQIIENASEEIRIALTADSFMITARTDKDLFPPSFTVTDPKMLDVIKTHMVDGMIAARQRYVDELVELGFASPGRITRKADGRIWFNSSMFELTE